MLYLRLLIFHLYLLSYKHNIKMDLINCKHNYFSWNVIQYGELYRTLAYKNLYSISVFGILNQSLHLQGFFICIETFLILFSLLTALLRIWGFLLIKYCLFIHSTLHCLHFWWSILYLLISMIICRNFQLHLILWIKYLIYLIFILLIRWKLFIDLKSTYLH